MEKYHYSKRALVLYQLQDFVVSKKTETLNIMFTDVEMTVQSHLIITVMKISVHSSDPALDGCPLQGRVHYQKPTEVAP